MRSKPVHLAAAGILLLPAPASGGLTTYRAHGPVNQIVDFSETAETFTSSRTWVDVPNASLKLIIPAGPSQLVMARFSTTAACGGPDAQAYCSVRIMAGNTEMLPSGGDIFMTDATPDTENLQAGVVERSLALRPGTYTIKVQAGIEDPNDYLALNGWHFNVMAADYGVAPNR